MELMTMRTCTVCHETLDFSAFYTYNGRTNSECKKCHAQYGRRNRENHRSQGLCTQCDNPVDPNGGTYCTACKHRATHKRVAIKVEVLVAYGGAFCACCGDTRLNLLTLDHINNDGTEHRKQTVPRGGHIFYRFLKKNGFPPGLQVLCFNCNLARWHWGSCPHETEKALLAHIT
jgi:hypothetical protein